ncbi:MAG: metallophosphoesterase family protein [Chloroflexota bacterium]
MSKITRIGLISDTHMPNRWLQLPERVFTLFADVDIIIHAGDVGELWVLDQLGELAPVVAVHGNDETPEAESALPYLQTLSASGHRMVVTHAHYPDRAEELASRGEDWQPHFERRVKFAKDNDATICIFGHTHIPANLIRNDIYLINAGAIASGNSWTKPLIQTIAIMTLTPNQAPEIIHYDLATGVEHPPYFNEAGFTPTHRYYQGVMWDDDFMLHREFIWADILPLDPKGRATLREQCYTVWNGERETASTAELVHALLALDNPLITHKLSEHDYFKQFVSI